MDQTQVTEFDVLASSYNSYINVLACKWLEK